jgi:hypothetical protein
MSLRVVKPRRMMLLPWKLVSPAPRLMPGTVRSASFKVVAARSSSSVRVTVVIACGVSTIDSVSFWIDGLVASLGARE